MGNCTSSGGAAANRSRGATKVIEVDEELMKATNAHAFDGIDGVKVKPVWGGELKVGDQIFGRRGATDKQRKGWTDDDGIGGKSDLIQDVKVTKIKSTNKSMTVYGEYDITLMGGKTVKRKVKKTFKKSDGFLLREKGSL